MHATVPTNALLRRACHASRTNLPADNVSELDRRWIGKTVAVERERKYLRVYGNTGGFARICVEKAVFGLVYKARFAFEIPFVLGTLWYKWRGWCGWCGLGGEWGSGGSNSPFGLKDLKFSLGFHGFCFFSFTCGWCAWCGWCGWWIVASGGVGG